MAIGKASILIVDDDADMREILRRNLSALGHLVYTAVGVAEAIEFLETNPVDLVITDLRMPGVNGMELVKYVRANLKNTEIIITGYPSIESAVESVRLGAEDYLSKPFTNDELLAIVEGALHKIYLRRGIQTALTAKSSPHGIIGVSPAMQEIYRFIEKAAGTNATVLISGESGTGKELVARAIHYTSKRASAPFVPVNCGAIPSELFESELFGHVKGAFTGASESRAGFFQTADGGTIFLDEISELNPSLQVKLLRVLQDTEVFMVGASRGRKIDVRILTATNKDLQTLVRQGVFREDFYFRLSVINITIPPLRDRGDDVLLMIKHFAAKFAQEAGRTAQQFSDKALQILRNYSWPGNVRELENLIQRLVVMTDGERIDVPDLPSLIRFTAPRQGSLTRTLREVEIEYIRNVLADVRSNKSRAAQILGIDRKTLREKLKDIPGEPLL